LRRPCFSVAWVFARTILDEFKTNRNLLLSELRQIYAAALQEKGMTLPHSLPFRITVQGGIGTAKEDKFLREYYCIEGTGWGHRSSSYQKQPMSMRRQDSYLSMLGEKIIISAMLHHLECRLTIYGEARVTYLYTARQRRKTRKQMHKKGFSSPTQNLRLNQFALHRANTKSSKLIN